MEPFFSSIYSNICPSKAYNNIFNIQVVSKKTSIESRGKVFQKFYLNIFWWSLSLALYIHIFVQANLTTTYFIYKLSLKKKTLIESRGKVFQKFYLNIFWLSLSLCIFPYSQGISTFYRLYGKRLWGSKNSNNCLLNKVAPLKKCYKKYIFLSVAR